MCSVLTEVLDWLSGGGLLTSAELYKLEKLLFSSSLSLSELNTTHSNKRNGSHLNKNIAKVREGVKKKINKKGRIFYLL